MSKVLAVAWRDFKHTVLTKAFMFAVFGMPILFGVVGLVAAMIIMNHEAPPLKGTVAIADASGEVVAAAQLEFDPARIRADRAVEMRDARQEVMDQGGMPEDMTEALDQPMMESVMFGSVRVEVTVEGVEGDPADESLQTRLRERIQSGDLLAAILVPPALLEIPSPSGDDDTPARYQVLIGEGLDSDHASLIERRIGQAIVRARIVRAGLDPETTIAMIERPRADTARVLEGGEAKAESEGMRDLIRLIPMVFMMLIWIAVISTGQHLMMSTIEEKSNKVMEVLLSAVSPLQLMTGKIVGLAGAGMIIIVMYSSLGIIGLIWAERADLLPARYLVYLGVYFFMAYFMVASIMAAVGSAVSDVREANSLVTPVMMIMVIPLMLWMPISAAPNGMIATVCSFIPPMTPFTMILRSTTEEGVPAWQIPATMAWGTICTIAMVWLASRIFRVGVLMQGKPPTPFQLLKWVRYS